MSIKPALLFLGILASFSAGATFSYQTLYQVDCPNTKTSIIAWVVNDSALPINRAIHLPLEQCHLQRVY